MLTPYEDLQQAIRDELNRTDLGPAVPDFITRFEAKARRALRDWLRTTITATAVTGDYLLPVTVSDVLSVSYNDGTAGAHNFPLDLISKQDYQRFMETQSSVQSIAGQLVYVDADIDAGTTTLRFWPPAGTIANLKIEVVKVLPSLSGTQPTNALLREAPDLYLAGSLAEASKFLQHDERIAIWEKDRDAGFKELRIQTERRLYGGSPRRMTLPRVFG